LKPPSKSLSAKEIRALTLIGLAILVIISALIAMNYFLVNRLPGGGDFIVKWAGGRAFLFEHIDPYSAYVPEEVQQLVYGRAARSGEQPFILDLPFPLLILFFPFALIPDVLIARAVFSSLAEITLFWMILWSLRFADWHPPPVLAALFFTAGIINYYSIASLLEGSMAIFLGMAYAGIIFALAAELDELAGALIFLSFFSWEIGAPFLILVLLRVIHQRRWRVLAGLVMLAFILLVLSFFLYPDWILPFLRAVVNNLRANFGFSARMIFVLIWPEHGDLINRIFTILLLIVLIYEWSGARAGDARRFYWAVCLTLAITPLLGQRTKIEGLVILSPSVCLILAIVQERWLKYGKLLVTLLLLFILGAPWLIYFHGIPALKGLEEQVLFIIAPLFTIIGLYWIRWWTIRPPRTWADRLATLSY
jgi:hypothetical protein